MHIQANASWIIKLVPYTKHSPVRSLTPDSDLLPLLYQPNQEIRNKNKKSEVPCLLTVSSFKKKNSMSLNGNYPDGQVIYWQNCIILWPWSSGRLKHVLTFSMSVFSLVSIQLHIFKARLCLSALLDCGLFLLSETGT